MAHAGERNVELPGGWLLTTAEVGKVLRQHPATVRRLIARGQLPAVRLGTDLRVFERDLDEYVSSQYSA